MSEPRVSIVMPVYNGATYLIDAVASVLEQSISEWELICVNDGSQDQSGDILDWFASQDQRVRVIHQENAGIVAALNRGCSEVKAPFICRMDCDDICFPKRLASQAAFMEEHKSCVVVGGSILEIDSDGDPLMVSRLACAHDDIVEQLLHRRTGHFHPSTMIRTAAFQRVGGYRSKYQWVEDHDLWLRMSLVGRLANQPDVVLCYRQHSASVCWQRSQQQRELMNGLLAEAYQARNEELPDHVLFAEGKRRSKAGAGKWARAAAKGGFTKSAWKHLAKTMAGSEPSVYKARMATEVGVRIFLSRLRPRPTAIQIPSFDRWHQRWQLSCGQPQAA